MTLQQKDDKGMTEWIYYNHALIPNKMPDEEVDLNEVNSGEIWKQNRGALFARWTTDYDFSEETSWWYEIKDEPFDISKLQSKKRNIIKKGIANFEIKEFEPMDLPEEYFNVSFKAYAHYSKNSRVILKKEDFFKNRTRLPSDYKCFGAFFRETGELCGFSTVHIVGKCISMTTHKAIPDFEKKQVNAALINGILEVFKKELSEGYYICDGERSILHETNFQSYLEKYFNFRKAYCKLHIEYRPAFGILVKLLYPFRVLLRPFSANRLVSYAIGVLKMEEIRRDNL